MHFTKKRKQLFYFFLLPFLIQCGGEKDRGARDDGASDLVPVITAIAPDIGPPGTTITISGSNFSNISSEVNVRFNGTLAEEITFASENQILAVVPSGASSGPLSVQIRTKEVIGPDFIIDEVSSTPKISSISKTQGIEGSTLIIAGSNFGENSTNLSIRFNNTLASKVTLISETTIEAIVPIGASSGPISVTVNEVMVEGPQFIVHPPINYKIAFLGDSNIGANAQAVLELVKTENAQVVVHPGDLNYAEVPADFETHINSILGADFPYFFGVGNHDDTVWLGSEGYQQYLEARLNRIGIPWEGQAGVQSSLTYQGIFFVSSAPDEFGISSAEAGNHISNALALTTTSWRISYWHKNQRLMQVGGKNDEAGWDVYEASRKGGALIVTGHEHSYCRTHEMQNFQTQDISSTNNTVHLIQDDINTTNEDEGRSFAFVSGLGGRSIRDAELDLENNPWWADVFSSNNGGQYGALFGEFNYDGDITLARFYFKDIDGKTRDVFFVRSNN